MVCAYIDALQINSSFISTPHGLFRLANPMAIQCGRIHIVEYHPSDQWARIVGTLLLDGANDRITTACPQASNIEISGRNMSQYSERVA